MSQPNLIARLACLAGVAVVAACEKPTVSVAECTGAELFGRPNASTGLSETECQPRCSDCDGEAWEQPEYTEKDIDALLQWQLVEPYPALTKDPYSEAAPAAPPAGTVCGMRPEPGQDKRYRLVTYSSPQAAKDAAAIVTHAGACGVCSTLKDLAVYMRENDLTAPVRECGLTHATGSAEQHVACIEALGFDRPCAQIWYFNSIHTRGLCAEPCFAALSAPYNQTDGSLNACLQCDEDKSGEVFKAVAGRTRRNTGIANAIARPCSEVHRIEHYYR